MKPINQYDHPRRPVCHGRVGRASAIKRTAHRAVAPRCRYFQKVCIAAVVATAAGLCGCRSVPFNRVEVTDIRSDATPELYYEDFDESYFRLRDGGLVDLVLRKQTRATADQCSG